MSRREAWLSAALVFVVALGVRAAAAMLIEFPKPEDTAYYVGVARNLVEGRGAVTDAIWSFHTPPLVFPKPAFEIWMPLPALLAAVPMWLAGLEAPIPLDAAFRAAQPPFVIAGAIVAVLAWRIAADVAAERGLPAGRARVLAVGTGLAAAVYLPLVLHSDLPDSTMLFAAFALGALVLMARVLRTPGAGVRDARLLALGACIGLAALCRNEFVWLALGWVWLVWRMPEGSLGARPWRSRLRLVGTVAVVSLAFYAPWMARNWAEFGTPLPGQAISNALSVTGFDIFAWNDEPTLDRYLAVGPAALLEMRVIGTWHNLGNVLLFLGLPVSLIGLVALPFQVRGAAALRPLVLYSAAAFLVTSLVFPVATTWGTFLHAAGPVHVLLLVSALGALDRVIVRVGARRGWTRPVAWLGPFLAVFASAVFTAALMPSFGSQSTDTARVYAALAERMAAIGEPFDPSGETVYIHDFPIWLAETERVPTLALPAESPADVLDLAAAFRGTRWLIASRDDHGAWPAVLDAPGPDTACFEEVDLGLPADPEQARALELVRVWRIVCDPPVATGTPSRLDRTSP